MALKQERGIPFTRGRHVGVDAVVNQNEARAAILREAPLVKEWHLSTFPFYANNAISVSQALDATNLNIVAFPSLSGTLHATAARVKITTVDNGERLRVCIYRYISDKASRESKFVKVPNSETVFGLDDQFIGAPLSSALDGISEIKPGQPYFLGYRSTSTAVRIPCSSVTTVSAFPVYQMTYPDQALPHYIPVAKLAKNYDGITPWITYVSNEAEQLF